MNKDVSEKQSKITYMSIEILTYQTKKNEIEIENIALESEKKELSVAVDKLREKESFLISNNKKLKIRNSHLNDQINKIYLEQKILAIKNLAIEYTHKVMVSGDCERFDDDAFIAYTEVPVGSNTAAYNLKKIIESQYYNSLNKEIKLIFEKRINDAIVSNINAMKRSVILDPKEVNSPEECEMLSISRAEVLDVVYNLIVELNRELKTDLKISKNKQTIIFE